MSQVEPFIIEGDPSHVWSFAKVWAALGFAVGLALAGLIVGAGGSGTSTSTLVITAAAAVLLMPVVLGGFAAMICLGWRARTLPVRYELTADRVRVLRGERELSSWAISDLSGATLVGEMSAIKVLVAFYAAPFGSKWPYMQVTMENSPEARPSYRTTAHVMIWGASEVERLDAELRNQFRVRKAANA